MKKIVFLIAFLHIATSQLHAQILATFTPDPAFNAVVSYPFANTNNTPNPANYVAALWTGNGTQGAWRSFFKINLSSIPANAVIDSAIFSFYADINSLWGNTGSPNFGIANGAYICRVTTQWNTNIFNWNTQPLYTLTNAAELDQSISVIQDYTHIDATDLIKDILLGTNNGFAFVLQQEMSKYNSQIFHASNGVESPTTPKLKVYYRFANSVNNFSEEPITYSKKGDQFSIFFDNNFEGTISIYQSTGALVKKETCNNQSIYHLNTSSLPTGIYFIELKNKMSSKTIKVLF